MNIAGHLIQTIVAGRFSGEPGSHYDYIMAGNGLFVRAEGALIKATIRLAQARVRGLADMQEKVELTHGRLPADLFGTAMQKMGYNLSEELYLAVVWENGRYELRIPEQQASAGGVTYLNLPNKVLDLHSHPTFAGRFSGIDNRDEVGFQLYGVIGELQTLMPEYSFRVGVYGYFKELTVKEVFTL